MSLELQAAGRSAVLGDATLAVIRGSGLRLAVLGQLDEYRDRTLGAPSVAALAADLAEVLGRWQAEATDRRVRERRITARDPAVRRELVRPLIEADPIWRELTAAIEVVRGAAEVTVRGS